MDVDSCTTNADDALVYPQPQFAVAKDWTAIPAPCDFLSATGEHDVNASPEGKPRVSDRQLGKVFVASVCAIYNHGSDEYLKKAFEALDVPHKILVHSFLSYVQSTKIHPSLTLGEVMISRPYECPSYYYSWHDGYEGVCGHCGKVSLTDPIFLFRVKRTIDDMGSMESRTILVPETYVIIPYNCPCMFDLPFPVREKWIRESFEEELKCLHKQKVDDLCAFSCFMRRAAAIRVEKIGGMIRNYLKDKKINARINAALEM